MSCKFSITSILFCAALSACGEIEEISSVKASGTRVGDSIVATRGDAVIEVINQESMPNAFGNADIFGRTRATGTTSFIFIGGTGSAANFIRRDVDVRSEKTTMNSTPIMVQNTSTTTYSGYVGNTNFGGKSNTSSAPIFLPPNTPADQVTGVREIPISVPIKGNNTIAIGGTKFTVLSATRNQLTYQIEG
jgi:hypothetical protein